MEDEGRRKGGEDMIDGGIRRDGEVEGYCEGRWGREGKDGRKGNGRWGEERMEGTELRGGGGWRESEKGKEVKKEGKKWTKMLSSL